MASEVVYREESAREVMVMAEEVRRELMGLLESLKETMEPDETLVSGWGGGEMGWWR